MNNSYQSVHPTYRGPPLETTPQSIVPPEDSTLSLIKQYRVKKTPSDHQTSVSTAHPLQRSYEGEPLPSGRKMPDYWDAPVVRMSE